VSKCYVEIYFDKIKDKVIKYIITISKSFADFIDSINVAYDANIQYNSYVNSVLKYRQISKQTIVMTLEFDLFIDESIFISLTKVIDNVDVFYKIENYNIEYAVSNDINNKFINSCYYLYAINDGQHIELRVSSYAEVLKVIQKFFNAELKGIISIAEIEKRFNNRDTYCIVIPLKFKEV
jgi:hypothetical protein